MCSSHQLLSMSSSLPLPQECALQLWPALQGVILACDLLNYNPHHCTVTWSEGCDGSYQRNQDIGMFPHAQTSSTPPSAPTPSTEFPQFPKCPWETECLLPQLGTGEQPDASGEQGQFKLPGAVFNGTATLPEPLWLLETGTLQITSPAASRAPAQRCVVRGLQVTSRACPCPCGLHQCSPTIWHPI